MKARFIILFFVLPFISPIPSQAQSKDWESKFRSVPSPENMREYMRRLSARPHHLGSPYDKENAEWILTKFKEFGFDAKIEIFDVLFPTPKRSEERRVGKECR